MPNWYRTSSLRGLDLAFSADVVWAGAKAVLESAFHEVTIDDETSSATFESRPRFLFTKRTLAVTVDATSDSTSTVKLVASGEYDATTRDSLFGLRVANQMAAEIFFRKLQTQVVNLNRAP